MEKWEVKRWKMPGSGSYHSLSRRVVHDLSIKLIVPWTSKTAMRTL